MLKSRSGKFHRRNGRGGHSKLLQAVDIAKLSEDLRQEMRDANSEARRKKMAKRLKVINAFQNVRKPTRVDDLEVIPVIPPDLRPLVPLDGGRFELRT